MMKKRTVAKTLGLTISLLFSAFSNAQLALDDDALLNQVSYQSVLELPSVPATTTLKYGEAAEQFIEGWAANGRKEIHPMGAGIVLVHGGCWMSQYGVDHVRPLATALANDGFNVFAIEYRRTGQLGGGWPGTLDDVNAAIKHVRTTYPRMTLTAVGHSAGGHLAMLAATDPTLGLNALIGLAAITDIESYAKGDNGCQKAAVAFMGGKPEERQAAYALANTRDKNVKPPLYLLSGEADTIVPPDQHRHPQSKRFSGENIGHFDWIHPQSEAYQRLLNTLSRLYD